MQLPQVQAKCELISTCEGHCQYKAELVITFGTDSRGALGYTQSLQLIFISHKRVPPCQKLSVQCCATSSSQSALDVDCCLLPLSLGNVGIDLEHKGLLLKRHQY